MFGVSVPEVLMVCVVILIVLGPDRLPEAAKTFGNLLAQFRKQADGVRRELYNSVYTPAEDFRQDFRNASQELQAVKEILPLSPEELLTCEDKARYEKERVEAEKDLKTEETELKLSEKLNSEKEDSQI